MSTNPNNCPNCDHHKTQRVIEKNDPQAMKLHCYQFRDEPTDVCKLHTGQLMNFFDYSPTGRLVKPHDPPMHRIPRPQNSSIQTFIRQMAEDFKNAGIEIDPLQ